MSRTIDPMGVSDPKRRCTATSRDGDRCKQTPIPGGTVCHYHGGATPQVRRKAKLRLLELVDPAIAKIARVLATTQDEKTALRAAEMILDRAGYGKSTTITVEDARDVIAARLDDIEAEYAAIEKGNDNDG